jgi:hypothetical protein
LRISSLVIDTRPISQIRHGAIAAGVILLALGRPRGKQTPANKTYREGTEARREQKPAATITLIVGLARCHPERSA